MGKQTYWEKLQDPRWQKLRLEIMERDGFACRACGATADTLTVHHGYYERGFDPWDYEPETLWTLCKKCHEDAGGWLALIHREIALIMPIDFVMADMYIMVKERRAGHKGRLAPSQSASDGSEVAAQ